MDQKLKELRKRAQLDGSENKAVFSSEMDLWSFQLHEKVEKLQKSDVPETKVEGKCDEKEEDEILAPDETLHEKPVGKGSAGALHFLRERGLLKKITDEDDHGGGEIQIERRDDYGRVLTQKEALRLASRRFRGKGPGKKKQEMQRRQYEEEQIMKQMESSDAPTLSVKRMKEAQAELKTPYLVLTRQTAHDCFCL